MSKCEIRWPGEPPCTEPAAVVMVSGCVHEHIIRELACAACCAEVHRFDDGCRECGADVMITVTAAGEATS